MKSLQSLVCAFAIGLSACASSDNIKDVVATRHKYVALLSQKSDVLLFEGDVQINNIRWIPDGTHHIKFYQKDEVSFLEVNYQDRTVDKYFSVDLNGGWRYVEEIRGKSIALIPSECTFNGISGEIFYDEAKELEIKREEHQTKLNYYLERIVKN